MSFISPALISQIYQALGQNRGRRAILLLRQHSFRHQPAQDKDLIPAVIRLGAQAYVAGDYARAEEHYRLGLALYDSCFGESHAEALRCVSGLILINSQSNASSAKMLDLIQRAEAITRRLHEAYMKPRVAVAERKVC